MRQRETERDRKREQGRKRVREKTARESQRDNIRVVACWERNDDGGRERTSERECNNE